MPDLSPIRREVLVDADPELAFEVFTERVGLWWPMAEHSVHGEGGSVAFTDGTIVETSAAGEVLLWGTVTEWAPPTSLAFTWHPGRTADNPSSVTVTFTAAGDQTLVRLEHAGWEVYADPTAAREEYGHGWPTVLGRFRDDVATRDKGDTWVALLHTPAVPLDGPVFADPRFGDHIAFLGRMSAAGYLVAAGSFGDEAGAGMTVLRLPGSGRMAEADRLATEDDLSVASGFFAVMVRPWNVVMSS
ncbi:hypothetical protein acdb102_32230 [Acidothermaceae bacterium B102]|nr:hypothetical protein acdb102_32230 [Acidothermaceae bacterium B102]